MANYNVDIAVAIKAAALNTFNTKLKTTERNIGNINTLLLATSKATGSFNDLSQSLGAANSNLNAAVRGTNSYKSAILQAARAERELNRELSARSRIQSQLSNSGSGFRAFSQKADQLSGRPLRREPLRVTRQRRKGLGQYSSSIGPSPQVSGAALPPDFNQEVAAATAAAKAVESFVTQTAQKRQDLSNKAHQKATELAKQLDRTQLDLDLKRSDTKGKLNKQTFDDLIKLDKNYGKDFDRRLKNRTEARKKAENDVADARKKADRKAQTRKSARQRGLQGAALGVGFPLLFGGGAGSIAGGLLGSGGGFGGQILGSAVGQQLDQFIQKTAELGVALSKSGLDIETVAKAAGELGSEAERVINELKEVAGAEEAAAVAADLLANKIGKDGVKALEEFGAAGQELGAAVSELNTEFMVLAATLLGPVLKGIVGLVQRANLASQTSKMLSEGGPEAERLRAVGNRVTEAGGSQDDRTIAMQNEAGRILDERRQAALQTARDTSKQNSISLQILQSENELLEGKGDLTEKINYLKAIEIEGLKLQRDLKKENISSLEREIALAEYAAGIRGLENRRESAFAAQAAEEQRKAEKDRRDAERAAKKIEEAQRKENAIRREINSLQISAFDLTYKSLALAEGEEKALQRQAAELTTKFDLLRKNIKLSTEDARIKDLLLQKLDLQKQLESNQIGSKQRSLQVEKAITAEKQKQALVAIETDVGRQIQDANFRPTGDSAQDAQIELRIDQIRRQEDVTTRLTNAIEEHQKTIDNPPNADAAMRAEEQRQSLQDQLDLYSQLLPQLDAAEQAQLKFNQALEAVQPITNAVVSGLFTAISAVAEGTKTAEEAFADFLKNIGDMLIQTAAQMIAQYIAIGIAKAFAGFGGGGGFNPSQLGDNLGGINTGFNLPAIPLQFAEGGYVTGPTNAVVGEGGEPEYIIPQSKMRESMDRYSRGARGSSVIPAVGGGGASGEGGGAAVAAPIDVRYTVERINSVDYVTADQFQVGMRQAATQGAKQGEQRALTTLRQNTTQRKRVGLQ